MFFLTKIALSFSLAALLGKRSFYNGFGGYMNTYIPKKADLQRRWYVVDAEDVVLGRLATHVANLLSGKGKPVWTPFLDHGDHVIVINAKKIKLTGRKWEQKVYYRHSGYPGGIKVVKVEDYRANRSDRIVEYAVKGMLPKNRLG